MSMDNLVFNDLVIKSFEGILRESKELYLQIFQMHELKNMILSQTEDKLHDFISNHISKA